MSAYIGRKHILLFLPAAFALGGCPSPQRPGVPPPQPHVKDGVFNATVTPAARPLVTIGTVNWQKTSPTQYGTFTFGWRNDALIGNPNSFQITVDANLGYGVLEVADGTSTLKLITPPRANGSVTCKQRNGWAILNSACYPTPQSPGYITPQAVSATKGAYSYELVNTCAGQVAPSPITQAWVVNRAAKCQTGQAAAAAIVLTVSPSRPLTPGVVNHYSLTLRDSGGGSASQYFDVVLPVTPMPTKTSGGGGGFGGGTTGGGTTTVPACPVAHYRLVCKSTNFDSPVEAPACAGSDPLADLTALYAQEISQGCTLVAAP